MEERDFLKKQIDLLGIVLAKLLADLLGSNTNSDGIGGIDKTNQIFKCQLDFDLESLIKIPANEIVSFLKNDKSLTNESLELIADILILNVEKSTYDQMSNEDKNDLLAKCLLIYEFTLNNDNTYSYDREQKIRKVQSLLLKS